LLPRRHPWIATYFSALQPSLSSHLLILLYSVHLFLPCSISHLLLIYDTQTFVCRLSSHCAVFNLTFVHFNDSAFQHRPSKIGGAKVGLDPVRTSLCVNFSNFSNFRKYSLICIAPKLERARVSATIVRNKLRDAQSARRQNNHQFRPQLLGASP
jgi:hypothetical protein